MPTISTALPDAAHKNAAEVLHGLGTPAEGLTQADADDRLRKYGPNELAQEKSQGWPVRLLKIMRNPLVILLAVLATVSFATGDIRAVP